MQSEVCCPVCVGELTSSKAEKEIKEFIQQYYKGEIQSNNRQILNYKEIDLYLPELKFGIEFNGMYWHREEKVGKKYHLNK